MRPSITLRDVLFVVFKHKTIILLVFLTTLASVIIATFLAQPTYEASSNLLVKYGREYIYRPEVGSDRVSSSFRTDREEIINLETQILTSRDLMERVVKEIGIRNIYPDLPVSEDRAVINTAVNRFEGNLAVQGIAESGVIRIRFQHSNPETTARVVNTMVDLFKEKHVQTFTDPQSSSFLEQKVTAYEKQLRNSEERLKNFKVSNETFSLDEQRTLLLNQRAQLDAEYKSSVNQIAELQQKLSSLKAQKKMVASTASNYTESDRYQILDESKAKLLDLQLKEQELSKKYTDSSAMMTGIREEISTVKRFLNDQERDIKGKVTTENRVYQDLQMQIIRTEADLRSQQGKSGVVKSQIDQIDGALRKISLPENELRELERQVNTNELNYQTYIKKLEESRISDDMDRLKMTNISVIQPAQTPVSPVKPRKQLNLLIGLILAICLSIGLAFTLEYLNQGLSTPQAVERKLAIPVLATVPFRRV